jgi:hypothetical protein
MEHPNGIDQRIVVATRDLPSRVSAKVEHLDLTRQRCWDLITQPSLVGKWFGDLSEDLTTALTARLDFGDGDFFIIDEISADAGHSIEYSWLFLGVGSKSRICWRILGRDGDVCVEMSDTNRNRTESSTAELRTGWLDFLQRFESFATVGTPTRYKVRGEFDCSVEIGATAEQAIDIVCAGGGLVDLVSIVIGSCIDPPLEARGSLSTHISDPTLTFALWEAGWTRSTHCQISLQGNGDGTLLQVKHSGWGEISEDEGVCAARRSYYSTRWRSALALAKERIEADLENL